MPIFEFRCRKCGSEFEHLVIKGSQDPECPSCHAREFDRLLSVSSVSSPHTRRKALREVKEQQGRMRREWSHEEHRRFHSHDH